MKITQYLNNKTNYSNDFDNEDFGKVYTQVEQERVNGKKELYYLETRAKRMLEVLGTQYNDGQFNNFQSWVYMYGNTLREKEERKLAEKSASLNVEQYLNQKVTITRLANNVMGGRSEHTVKGKIVKTHDDRLILMPKGSRTKGYILDGINQPILSVKLGWL